MRYGTCHFVDTSSAFTYYRAQGIDRAGVYDKLRNKEIVIGAPVLGLGEHRQIDNDGRYWIVANAAECAA
jgi:hypothetical protein